MFLRHNEAKQTETEFGTKKKKVYCRAIQGAGGSCLKALKPPPGFQLCALVVNILHLLEGRFCTHLQNNLGNVHQILLLSYLRGAEAEDARKGCGKVPWCPALLHMVSLLVNG